MVSPREFPAASAEHLSAQEKRELLKRLLRDGATAATAEYALSYNQRSIWFMHRLAPASAAYNVPYVFRALAPIDAEALRRAFRGLTLRHSILRTTYSATAPVQRIESSADPDFVIIDAGTWSEEAVWAAIGDDAHAPFDLTRGPVLRVRVYGRGAAAPFVTVTFHHIAYDLWSMVSLVSDLAMLYRAEVEGTPARPAPVYQYIDFVEWQAKMLATDCERLWNFWREQLDGRLPVLELPTDRTRPDSQTYVGTTLRRELPDALTSAVAALARAEETTIFSVLLAAFELLIHDLSGQPDVLVGTPAAGRTRAEFEDLIGYFLNTLPLRSRLAAGQDFRAFLRQTRQTVRGALEHQDYPVELLAERLRPARSAGHAAFFQTMFVLNRAHRLDREAPQGSTSSGGPGDLRLERIPLDLHVAQFDLSLQIDQGDESLTALWEYNTDVFAEPTIARWAERFERLLEAIVANPEALVSGLLAAVRARPLGRRNVIEPRTDAEQLVAEAFCDVLGLDRVSVDESLFDLGADSFGAAQVVARLAPIAGTELDLGTIFRAPTVEGLAARLEEILLNSDPAA